MSTLTELENKKANLESNKATIQRLVDTTKSSISMMESNRSAYERAIENCVLFRNWISLKDADIVAEHKSMDKKWREGIISALNNNQFKITADFTPEMLSDDGKIYIKMQSP